MSAASLRRRVSETWRITLRWRHRFTYALADQGFYSATNFLFTILLALWLPLDAFGRYVIIWTAVAFIEGIQVALITDSLPSIASAYGRENHERLDSAAFWIATGYGAASSLAITVCAAALTPWHTAYGGPLLVLVAINPLQRLYLFFRRLCYIRDRQHIAAAASLAYDAAMIAGGALLAGSGTLSLVTAVTAWGGGALAGIVVASIMSMRRVRPVPLPFIVWLAGRLWYSGRWLAAAAIASWVKNWAIFPIIAAIGGPGAAGIVRALQNLLTPILQFNAALHLTLLPRVADKVVETGNDYPRQFALRATAIFAGIVIAYCAVILGAAKFLLPLVYKKPEIAVASSLLWPLAVALALDSGRAAASIALLSAGNTRAIFIARFTSLVGFGCSALFLGHLFNIAGILWSTAFASAIGTAILLKAALAPMR